MDDVGAGRISLQRNANRLWARTGIEHRSRNCDLVVTAISPGEDDRLTAAQPRRVADPDPDKVVWNSERHFDGRGAELLAVALLNRFRTRMGKVRSVVERRWIVEGDALISILVADHHTGPPWPIGRQLFKINRDVCTPGRVHE